MNSSQSTLFPCPKCGTARGEVNATCKQCGWNPNTTYVTDEPKPQPYSIFAAMVIGFLSLLPLVYVFFSFAIMLMAFSGRGMPNNNAMNWWFAMHFVTVILVWSLLGFYVYYLFKTKHVKQEQKALWAVVLFLGNVFAMP